MGSLLEGAPHLSDVDGNKLFYTCSSLPTLHQRPDLSLALIRTSRTSGHHVSLSSRIIPNKRDSLTTGSGSPSVREQKGMHSLFFVWLNIIIVVFFSFRHIPMLLTLSLISLNLCSIANHLPGIPSPQQSITPCGPRVGRRGTQSLSR